MKKIGSIYQYIIKIFIVLFMVAIPSEVWSAPISMHIQSSPVHKVVESIARNGHINIIGTESLEGVITIHINNEEPIDAIKRIGAIKHFIVEEAEGVVIVRSSQVAGDVRTIRSIKPVYLRPEKVEHIISMIVPKDRISVVNETNQVLYYGTASEELAVREVINGLDRAPIQIHLEVAVIAMEHSYSKELGIQWSWLGMTHHGKEVKEDVGSIKFGRASDGVPYKFLFKPTLSAHENRGNTVLVARPSLTTINGEEAKILIGDRVPVQVESIQDGISRTSIRYEEAGIRLTCRPFIEEDGMIDADILAEVSNPSLVPEMKAYRITTREAKTRVRLRDGDVLVIGGLMDSRTMEQQQKIPILGDIPLLGKLFKHARKTKDRVELFILVKAFKEQA